MTVISPHDWFRITCISFTYSYLICSANIGSYRLFGKYLGNFPEPGSLYARLLVGVFGTAAASFFGVYLDRLLFNTPVTFEYIRNILLLNFTVVFSIIGFMAVFLSLELKNERITAELRQHEIEKERMQRLKLKAELEALQTKINPHFLFNTLNSIASLIPVDPAAAESMVEKLSALFRYTLLRSGNAVVELHEEIAIVRSYLEIEKLRFGKRLEYTIEMSPEAEHANIPALLLQPLVENSIKYAISPSVQGGLIEVTADVKGATLQITVRDSGKGFSETGGTGFGLKSIRERLALLYKEGADLEIFHDGNTNVQITLPYTEGKA